MKEYRVMGTIYRDQNEARTDVRSGACVFNCYTSEHIIICDTEEKIPDLFLDAYGGEMKMLHGHPYLYVLNENGWKRITE